MPLISVIMSVYNDEKYVPKAVESILNQTFTDFEFIITDDCSKDNSLKILREYAEKDDRIVLIENKENLKLTKNLNNMLKTAKGDLIARMDSDDVSFPERFEKQIEIFRKDPDVDFVFTGTMLMDNEGNEICESWRPESVSKILERMKINSYIPHPTIMAKKRFFSEAGYYTEHKGYGQEDRELWEKFMGLGVKFFYLNEVLLYYRLNPAGVTFQIRNYGEIYNYKKINICIDNHAKMKALRLFMKNFSKMSLKHCVFIILKLIIPNCMRYYKAELIHRLKK
jgi:glycosyltransferase EpsE